MRMASLQRLERGATQLEEVLGRGFGLDWKTTRSKPPLAKPDPVIDGHLLIVCTEHEIGTAYDSVMPDQASRADLPFHSLDSLETTTCQFSQACLEVFSGQSILCLGFLKTCILPAAWSRHQYQCPQRPKRPAGFSRRSLG